MKESWSRKRKRIKFQEGIMKGIRNSNAWRLINSCNLVGKIKSRRKLE
jgi:hypothetical protein